MLHIDGFSLLVGLPTPSSVFVPLSRYCLIMQKHTAQLADLGDLPSYFTAYMHHFHVLVTEYEWSAVRNYHMNFFDARLDDMKRGIYDTWAWPDPLLSGQFLYAHARPVSSSASSKAKKQPSNNETQICLNWNSGKCTSPCPNHRICYDRRGFPGDTLDRVREYGVNAQELVTTSSTRLLMTT